MPRIFSGFLGLVLSRRNTHCGNLRQRVWQRLMDLISCVPLSIQTPPFLSESSYRKQRSSAGRWSLFNSNSRSPADALEQARFEDEGVESAARMLLLRYGVVFRDLVALENNVPRWGVLLRMFRRLEDRGEVRGGRFVNGYRGEQFALPDVPRVCARQEAVRTAVLSRSPELTR